MIKTHYNVLGVMSGTSLDGIDLANLTFTFDNEWKFIIHSAETLSYNNYWIEKLKGLTSNSIEELRRLDVDYTIYISQAINEFIVRNKIKNIDAVCSHGHTALHQPQSGLTYQIGNLSNLATLINQKVVCDFRVQDVELGGQGAPLVPIGDALLFAEYDFCLNLGGFANISTENNNKRIAYDICPVNIVLNHYVNRLGLDYDDKGKLALQGTINEQLLLKLNELPYYKLSHPKSLGLEWVNKEVLPLIDSFQLNVKDVLRTFVEHISNQISFEINKKDSTSVLITGGGAYNDFLINRIKKQTKNRIIIPNKNLIEFKEALIFGFLGVLKLNDKINCLQSVTGASKDHSSGKIFNP